MLEMAKRILTMAPERLPIGMSVARSGSTLGARSGSRKKRKAKTPSQVNVSVPMRDVSIGTVSIACTVIHILPHQENCFLLVQV
jgi:hypothetical protein